MKTEFPENLFDENTLKDAIACAVLMSSIDGEIHDTEWQVIQSFANKYWKDDYMDFNTFQGEITGKIESVFNEEETFQEKLNQFLEKLTGNLTSQQKNIVLNLVGDVMAADGIMTLDESKLFASLMDKLGIRIN